ncbi:MAG: YqaJ-like viral recombinase [SAR86 cluster bacterium]|uniref:YqaJ-like viral recombinase n=1 Tax=SAR86 cluster bacterium TaxID=2030880 RepID=A0A2A5AXT3_9GAMM|nr:MAG: YqaJ-like viral recombinase [SAR86 cluster bacterium]
MTHKPTLEPHLDITKVGNVSYYHRLTQGSDEWLDLRKGMLTASTMKLALSEKTLKIANNDKIRQQIYQLAAERIGCPSGDNFVSYAMERGNLEEVEARIAYSAAFEPVAECGYVINDKLGFPIGWSPDGLVGNDGGTESKSRMPKYQVQTICEHYGEHENTPIPSEFMLQVQTGLFVSERKWIDFLSYSNGMNMAPIRCFPIAKYQEAIELAAIETEKGIDRVVAKYMSVVDVPDNRITPVKFVDYNEEITA